MKFEDEDCKRVPLVQMPVWGTLYDRAVNVVSVYKERIAGMLYREVKQGKIAITQPMHAWVAGQLARVWGNERFGDVVPLEEVCLGAEQHDVGHTAWEQAPTLNPQTGLPYSFLEMPRQLHVQLWSEAASRILPQGRYAALLVSLHGTRLYQRYDTVNDLPENARAVQRYLEREHAFQEGLLASLRSDPHYKSYASDEVVARNRQLVGIWDALSLAICFGRTSPLSWEQVPTDTGSTTLSFSARDDDPATLFLTPWPFHRQSVTLVYEGRYLNETFSDETMMRHALKAAAWVTLQTILLPGETE
jgi:hypothetical protein